MNDALEAPLKLEEAVGFARVAYADERGFGALISAGTDSTRLASDPSSTKCSTPTVLSAFPEPYDFTFTHRQAVNYPGIAPLTPDGWTEEPVVIVHCAPGLVYLPPPGARCPGCGTRYAASAT